MEKALHLLVDRKLREDRREPGKELFEDTTSDPLSPTRPHLPQFYNLLTVYSNFESTSGLNH
jgi:hypothetical protein